MADGEYQCLCAEGFQDQCPCTERPARHGETCECGRPALVVYRTERFGEVPFCGIPDGGHKGGRDA